MGFVIGLLMIALGLAGIVIAVTGTQGQVWSALTGHTASGTLLGNPAATTSSSVTNQPAPATSPGIMV